MGVSSMKKIVRMLFVTAVILVITGFNGQFISASQPPSNSNKGETGGEFSESGQEFTTIDEDGTYHPVSKEQLTVDSGKADYNKGIMVMTYDPDIDYATGVVNFRTKESERYNTEYVEDKTGTAGYTNGFYGADAAFLGYSGDMSEVKFMLSGVTGWVKSDEVKVYDNSGNGYNVSYYMSKGGKLYHYICYNMAIEGGSPSYSAIYHGTKPSYLSNDVKYYSYDGHYFYTSYAEMLTDYKHNTRSNAVNSDNPYYNYYQYLSHRSVSSYSGKQLDEAIASLAQGTEAAYDRTSKMKNEGSSFVSNQNEYGVNAMMAIGVAGNESAWGCSNISYENNNLFGHAAYDSDPHGSAVSYSSVDYSIYYHCAKFISLGYLDAVTDGRYFGAFLGNKASGINVKYASDPYWGEKAAANAWRIDEYLGGKDSNRYTIAIKDTLSNNHNNFDIKSSTSDSSATLYTTAMHKGESNSPSSYGFIVLGTENGYYKIQSDMQVDSKRSEVVNQESYTFGESYAYVKQNQNLVLINSGKKSVTDIVQDENLSVATNYASPRPSDETITISASAKYTTINTYKFVWMKDDWDKWGVIQEGVSNNCSWTPALAGEYKIYVDFTDIYGNKATKIIDYTIEDQNYTPKSINIEGDNLLTSYNNKITGSVSGNTKELQYKFVWMQDNWNKWGVIKDFSTSNSCTFNPSTAGNYEIFMDVKDTNGTIKSISKVFKAVSEGWQYTSLGVSGNFQSGGTINITPAITGDASDLQYKYVWMQDDWNKWGVIKDYSTSKTCSYVPKAAGTYTVYVDVKDSNGRTKTLSKEFEVSKQVITFNSISTDLASPQYVNKTITITANTSGNTNGLEYKYVWMKNNWDQWGVISNFSDKNRCSWTPQSAGSYTMYVDVKSLDGDIVTKTMDYTVETVSYKDISAPDIATTGNAITIKPNVTGDLTGVTYKYVWMKDDWNEWGVIKGFSSTPSIEYIPKTPGTYYFYVDVKDAGGNIFTKYCVVNVSLCWNYSSLSLSNTAVNRGTTVIITPNVTNGTNLKYKYVWMKDNWNSWGVISDFSSDNKCSWTPTSPGTYTIYTDVKDSYGNIVTKTNQVVIK